MKKFLFLSLIAITIIGCSVDNEELDFDAQQVLEKNAVFEIEGCEAQSLDFGDSGELLVTNDEDYLYVTFSASPGNSLTKARLQIGNTLEDFPIVGQGNLPPGQMEHQKDFPSGVEAHTFVVPLNLYEDCHYIAANAIFSGGSNSGSFWAGDLEGRRGNWSYFQYCTQTCTPVCEPVNAGADNSTTISFSEAAALESWDEVRNLYFSLLGTSVPRDGTFDPTIWALITEFNEQGVGEYSTVYTIGEGECTDSVILTVIVEEDQQEPACEGVSAGRDNSITITESQAAAIPSWDEVRKLYLSLLESGISREGSFDPTIWEMITDWQQRRTGEFTLEYTITEGDCTDSALLTVIVVPD